MRFRQSSITLELGGISWENRQPADIRGSHPRFGLPCGEKFPSGAKIKPMRFSLIMATVGRTEETRKFLTSLGDQDYRDFDLVVVDQNTDERLAPILAPYEGKFPILHVRPGSKGAAKARNTGIEHAEGDLIAFPDDDCSYPPGLLSRAARFFSKHPNEDGLTGRSTDERGETNMGRFAAEPGAIDRMNVWGRGIEYAIFLRRDRVRGAWFDERLGPGADTPWGAGEATDYLLQLLDRGASLHYDPDITVIHPSGVPPYTDESIRKARSYGRGMGYVLKKHKMPPRLKAKWLYRPLGGSILSLAALRFSKARFYWNIFRGRLRGLL